MTAQPVSRLPLHAVLASNLVSVLFTSVSALAIPWLVLTTSGSAARTGLVVFAELAPYVTMQALAGPWVERVGPRRAAWAGNVIAGPVILCVPALSAAGALGLAAIVAVVAVVGTLRGVADCAVAPLVPEAARRGGTPLERAAGLNSSAREAAMLLGAPAAAALLTVLEPAMVLLVCGSGFIATAIVLLAGVPADMGGPARGGATEGRYLRRVTAGLGFVFADPLLRWIVLMVAASNLLNNARYSVLLPSWVREDGLAPATLGLVSGAISLGALVGSLLGSWLAPRLRRWAVYAIGFALGGAPLTIAMAIGWSPSATAAVALVSGLAAGGINPIIGAVQYERVPTELLPRVLGAIKALAWTGLPLGPVLGGLLVDGSGLLVALLATGAVSLLLALLPFTVRTFRLLDQRPG
ncbi:MFS transporter [Jiangella endophytica]|uniref:MFS transporter n=1 Tax=Jiangella endophytica TaxID=1623398 RepID=UPI001300552D|nr:MFS transporter [Jiangella endophytica]